LEAQAAQGKIGVAAEQEDSESEKAEELETLRYSVLVERYLKTHKYECFNIVKPWKFKTTDRTEAHRKDIEKFSSFVDNAKGIESKNVEKNKVLNTKIDEEKKKMTQIVYFYDIFTKIKSRM